MSSKETVEKLIADALENPEELDETMLELAKKRAEELGMAWTPQLEEAARHILDSGADTARRESFAICMMAARGGIEVTTSLLALTDSPTQDLEKAKRKLVTALMNMREVLVQMAEASGGLKK